jgi:hypothetical protein
VWPSVGCTCGEGRPAADGEKVNEDCGVPRLLRTQMHGRSGFQVADKKKRKIR